MRAIHQDLQFITPDSLSSRLKDPHCGPICQKTQNPPGPFVPVPYDYTVMITNNISITFFCDMYAKQIYSLVTLQQRYCDKTLQEIGEVNSFQEWVLRNRRKMGNPCTEYRVHKSKLYSYSEDISDNAKIKFQQMLKIVYVHKA